MKQIVIQITQKGPDQVEVYLVDLSVKSSTVTAMEEKTAMVFSNTLIRALRMIKEGKSMEILEEGL